MCGGSAWDKSEMRESHAQCVRLESPGIVRAELLLHLSNFHYHIKKWAGLEPEIPGLKSGPTPALSIRVMIRSFCVIFWSPHLSCPLFACSSCPCDCLPCSWLFPPVWLLAPPSSCPPVSRSPVSNQLQLPHLNPTGLLPQCWFVLFSSCLSLTCCQ